MNFKIQCLVILALTIFSCKKEDKTTPSGSGTCTTDTLWHSGMPKVMTYDSQNRPSKLITYTSAGGSVNEQITYTYQDTGVVIDYYSYNYGTGKVTASLDKNGNFDKVHIIYPNWQPTDADYDFDADKQLQKVSFTYHDPTTYDLMTTYSFKWAGGDITDMSRYDTVVYINPSYTGGTSIIGYYYKAKFTNSTKLNTGYRNIYFYTFMNWLDYPFMGVLPKHLIDKIDYVESPTSTTTTTYTYQFNDKDLVISDMDYSKITYKCK